MPCLLQVIPLHLDVILHVIFVREDIPAKIRKKSLSKDRGILFVELNLRKKKILFVVPMTQIKVILQIIILRKTSDIQMSKYDNFLIAVNFDFETSKLQ